MVTKKTKAVILATGLVGVLLISPITFAKNTKDKIKVASVVAETEATESQKLEIVDTDGLSMESIVGTNKIVCETDVQSNDSEIVEPETFVSVAEIDITTEEITTEVTETTEVVEDTTEVVEETTEVVEDTTEMVEEQTETADISDVDTVFGYQLQYSAPYYVCDEPLTDWMGVKYFNEHKETYYSELVLPGEGLDIPGRHVADDGTIRDADGYIVVASDLNYLPRYSVVLTSLGPAKVYDTGCAYGTIDIYVHW